MTIAAQERVGHGFGAGRAVILGGFGPHGVEYSIPAGKLKATPLIHPAVRDLFLDVAKHPGFQDVLRRVSTGGGGSLSGLTTAAKALYSVLLWQLSGRPLVIVVDGNR